jgi:hypothetical protein
LAGYFVARCSRQGAAKATYDEYEFDGTQFVGAMGEALDFDPNESLNNGTFNQKLPAVTLEAKAPLLEKLWELARAEWQ